MSATAIKTDLKNLTQEGLIRYVESLGEPAFRARQMLAWLYKAGITEFDEMTDLAKSFRALLKQHAVLSRFDDPIVEVSRDGSAKFAFQLQDNNSIETVLIPEEERNTLCVSSQVGCAMGCKFCLTGSMGFTRNLQVGEIVNQVCAVRDWMIEQKMGNLTNLVFMGMGEPLANLNAVIDAISLLTEQRGLDFASRKITVSTCGLVPQMLELGERTNVNLAVSLHATDDATRSRIMPVNDRYPLDELMEACLHFPHKRRQRIMFEYTLLTGINDSVEDANRLAGLLRHIPCKINLLAMNVTGNSSFSSPDHGIILRFQRILMEKGYTVFIRQSRGADISAACGQLAGKSLSSGSEHILS